MYDPKGNGKDRTVRSVQFTETEPPDHLRGIVHRFLELKTDEPLVKDYKFHALPDACTYIVFDQLNTKITGVSKLRAQSEEFNLGKVFHFVNIRFLPGVWQDKHETISFGLLDTPYLGALPLIEINQELTQIASAEKINILSKLVEKLLDDKMVMANPTTEKILQNLDAIHTVSDMAELANISTRQLQRTLKRTTGFTPHDLLKILRLQQTLDGRDIDSYADQSHFIHSFKNATGYTPVKHNKKFDV